MRQNPGHLIDLAPTVLDLAGGKWPETINGRPVPKPPGKSLVPVFVRDNSVTHDSFWWYHDGNRALRMGDWKLVADHKSPWELYDLRTDRSESTNLASAYPEKVKDLEQSWTKQMEQFSALARQDTP